MPGPLQATSGPAVTPNDPVLSLQAQMEQGDFMVGLRPVVAPKSAARVQELAGAGAFKSGQLDLADNKAFAILAASPEAVTKLGKPRVSGEKNRIAPASGLVYFDGQSRLAIALGPATPEGTGWVCVGQVQIPGSVLHAWSQGEPGSRRMIYFGNLRG
jgi:hypothetical protein